MSGNSKATHPKPLDLRIEMRDGQPVVYLGKEAVGGFTSLDGAKAAIAQWQAAGEVERWGVDIDLDDNHPVVVRLAEAEGLIEELVEAKASDGAELAKFKADARARNEASGKGGDNSVASRRRALLLECAYAGVLYHRILAEPKDKGSVAVKIQSRWKHADPACPELRTLDDILAALRKADQLLK
jgi:hypothetical protein